MCINDIDTTEITHNVKGSPYVTCNITYTFHNNHTNDRPI